MHDMGLNVSVKRVSENGEEYGVPVRAQVRGQCATVDQREESDRERLTNKRTGRCAVNIDPFSPNNSRLIINMPRPRLLYVQHVTEEVREREGDCAK
jgi:hypothetical protein